MGFHTRECHELASVIEYVESTLHMNVSGIVAHSKGGMASSRFAMDREGHGRPLLLLGSPSKVSIAQWLSEEHTQALLTAGRVVMYEDAESS